MFTKEKGADCNWVCNSTNQNYKNFTTLFLACWSEDPDIISFILKHTSKYDVRATFDNKHGKFSYTPVEYLLNRYKPEYYNIVKDIVEDKKCDISDFCTFSTTTTSTPVLFYSVHNDKKLRDLVLKNVDIDKLQDRECRDEIEINGKKKPRSFSVFSALCFWYDPKDFDCMKMIQKMLEKNIDVNAMLKVGDDYEVSPLLAFVKKDNPNQYEDVIKQLLEKGADPNKMCQYDTETKFTPVHYVAGEGNDVLLKLFKENGGDLRKKNSHGESPLDKFAEYRKKHKANDAETLGYLYFYDDKKVDWTHIKGLNPQAKTEDRRNILHITIQNGDEENSINLLKAYLNLWKEQDSNGKNALDYAFKERLTEMLNKIVDGKNPIGSALFSVIDNALFSGDTGFLEKSLENSSDDFSRIRRQVEFGNRKLNVDTVVYTAIFDYAEHAESNEGLEKKKGNKRRVLEVLCNGKAKFSKEGLNDKFSGNPPIVLCEKDNDESIKRLLLDYGAEPLIKGIEGFSAVDYAFRNNQSGIIDWLLKRKVQIGNAIFSAIDGELEAAADSQTSWRLTSGKASSKRPRL